MPRHKRKVRAAPPAPPPASPPSSRGEGRPALLWAVLPHLVFAALWLFTFKAWLLPFQDSGREVGVASRLARGEALYGGVAYFYGPLSALLDGLILRLAGLRLDALVALRLAVALLGVEALRRLSRRLFDSQASAAFATAAVVSVCLFDSAGGCWAFPYSIASLEGFVLGLWGLETALSASRRVHVVVAALLAALAAGTKLELVPLALGGVGIALVLRRPLREAATAVAAAAVGGALFWLVPLARWGLALMKTQGFLIALDVPAPWKLLYRNIAFGVFTAEAGILSQALRFYLPGLLLALVAIGLVRSFGGQTRTVAALLLVLGGVAGALRYNMGVHLLVPLSLVVVAVEAIRTFRKGRNAARDPRTVALLAIGAAMLALFLRQPFYLYRFLPYSAFSGPLPLLVSLSALSGLLAGRRAAASFLAGLALGAPLSTVPEWGEDERRWVRFPHGSFRLPLAEADLMEGLVERIRRDTGEGAFVAGFPEPGLVLFLSDRRNPFPWEHFSIGDQGEAAESRMIETVMARRVEAAFVLNRPMTEFGGKFFGQGYLKRFMTVFRDRMERVDRIGGPPRGERPRALRADSAVWYLPKAPPVP